LDGAAVIAVDSPPVHALSPGAPKGQDAALDRAPAYSTVRALVVMSAGRTFIAEAHIIELEDMAWGRGDGGFQREMGGRWTPARFLQGLAAEGRRFRDYDQERRA
jgi:enoyl-CoA hydratase/carnithine racemase